MKKQLFFSLAFLSLSFSQLLMAQASDVKKHDPNVFDEKAAYEQAKAKGLKSSEQKGYVDFLRNDFSTQKALAKQKHKHSPYEAGSSEISETVIYLDPNKPMSVGCPNMGFEQYNFNGWTGGIGTSGTGPAGGNPNYTSTGTTIINSGGNNTSVFSTANYHTIMTLPPVSNVFPNVPAQGYDTNAAKLINGIYYSQIPTRSPFSFDPVSVRMNCANSNYRACRLKYITTSSPTNQRLSFSYAVVLQNPNGHLVNESPYFKVEVKNEATGGTLPGCTSYTFNPKSTSPADSLFQSDIGGSFDPTFYRKWQYYSVDLSSLPAGTNVSINFEVGGCTLGGHWGYAYVDAECGGIGTPYANMCSGSNYATLVAPTGFNTYQWYGPGGLIVGATNDTLVQGPPVGPIPAPGQTYTVNMVSPGGCTITKTVSIGFTTVSIVNLNSTSSCAGGNSGTAYVQAIGSNGIYTYSWTSTSGPNTGSVVSTSQTATGLAPGTYSVLVASTSCGQVSANISVGVSPPFFYSLTRPFCGNVTNIPQAGGSNYTWYYGTTLIPAPAGINDTLYINNAINNDVYSVVYTNAQGCRDSIAYTLTQIAGGSAYFSNTTNVCPGNTNGSTVINLNTPFGGPYNYNISGPSGVVTTTVTSALTLTMSPLAAGTYTSLISDGFCFYNNTVTIAPIQTNFTMTPTNTVLCFPEEFTLNMDFGETAPTSCGLSSTGSCSTPNSIQLGFGSSVNSTTSYPAIYGNWYRNTRHQILYKASELIAAGVQAGKLSSISFNISTINGTTSYPDFSIKLKCTSEQDMTSTTFDQTGLIQVYYAPSINITTGWNTYTFANAYEWDGVSNLLIDVCNSQTMPSYTQNSSSPYSITPFASVRWYNSDGTVACPIPTGSSYAPNNTYRPNIKFGNCGASNPASYTVAVSSNGTITANYANDSIRIAPTFSAPPVPTGSVIYTISVTNPIGGCVATKTLQIIYPPLTTTVTTAVTNATLCEGGNSTLSASGAFNYNWFYNQGGVLVPISTNSVINVTPPAVGTNTYVVTGFAPCPSSAPDTKTITINVTPMTNLIVTPMPDITKCKDRPFLLTTAAGSSLPANAGTPYTYSWTTLPGNNPAPGATNSTTYTANSNSTTTLVVTISGVCAYSTSDTVVVKNFVNDLAISIVDTSSACAGTPFTLNALATGGYPTYHYEWTMVPSPSILSNTAVFNSISPDTQGNYTIVVYVSDSCGYNTTDYQVINVLPPCAIMIPNIITPNGDNANDYFKITNIEHHPNTNVTIFDRWGLKVYENPNYNNEWKGDGVSDGTFFYVIDVPDDKKYSGFITVFKGK